MKLFHFVDCAVLGETFLWQTPSHYSGLWAEFRPKLGDRPP